jgi:hypothetical protein
VLFDGYLSAVAGDASPTSAPAARILALYLARGLDFLRDLRGSYTCLVLDARDGHAHLFNDRRGSRPSFQLRVDRQHVRIAPEVASLAAAATPRGLDPVAIGEFLLFAGQFGTRTLFTDIARQPPASLQTFAANTVTRHRYWALEVAPEAEGATEEVLVTRFIDLLAGGLARQLAATRDAFLFLSGGTDSRVVLAMLRLLGHPLPSVTYGTGAGDDAPIAVELARLANMPHVFLPVALETLHEGFEAAACHADCRAETVDFPAMPQLLDTLGGRHGAFLNGDMPMYGVPVTTRREALQKMGMITLREAPRLSDLLQPEAGRVIDAALRRMAAQTLADNPTLAPADLHDKIYFEQRLANKQNAFTAAKLRHFEPVQGWLDEDVVDFLYRIPGGMRTGKRLAYLALTRVAPDLHAVPYARVDSIPLARNFREQVPASPALTALLARELGSGLDPRLAALVNSRVLHASVEALLHGTPFPLDSGHWWSHLPGAWRLTARRHRADRVNPVSTLLRLAQLNIYLKHVDGLL